MKSSPDLDLDQAMPNVELNIFKFQAPRLIIFLSYRAFDLEIDVTMTNIEQKIHNYYNITYSSCCKINYSSFFSQKCNVQLIFENFSKTRLFEFFKIFQTPAIWLVHYFQNNPLNKYTGKLYSFYENNQ